ncbi:hypothetical protein L7F22_009688 [Adiantum nelumboides]|nr:hypothetical protein [Adiantum nelumboides]
MYEEESKLLFLSLEAFQFDEEENQIQYFLNGDFETNQIFWDIDLESDFKVFHLQMLILEIMKRLVLMVAKLRVENTEVFENQGLSFGVIASEKAEMTSSVAGSRISPLVEAGHTNTNTISCRKHTRRSFRSPNLFRSALVRLYFSLSHRKRRFLGIKAISSATETIQETEPLTKKDLVEYLSSGCVPKEEWRIGTEHEKFGFELETLRPIRFEQIASLLEGIAGRYSWDKIIEDGLIFGLKKDGKSVTLEGGGQVELSGAPLKNIHETSAEISSHLSEVTDIARELGIGFLGCGFQPKWLLGDMPMMPQDKINVMRNCFDISGETGYDVMVRTCTVQVNLDFESEEDMVNKYRAELGLPCNLCIATALFSNSPFMEGKPNGFVSYRSHLYLGTDDNRTGMLPFVFDEDFGFEKYVDYALDVPMYYARHNDRLINCCGMSFRDYIAGKLPILSGAKATLKDWGNHLTQLYGEVRLKKILEMRGADVGPARQLCALPAFWVGLLYDETSLQAALKLIEDWTPEERQMLREKAPRLGLKVPFRDSLLRHVAQDVVKLAKEGLQRRGFNEEEFLDQIVEVSRTGITPAERLLDLYNSGWKENIDPIFQELRY